MSLDRPARLPGRIDHRRRAVLPRHHAEPHPGRRPGPPRTVRERVLPLVLRPCGWAVAAGRPAARRAAPEPARARALGAVHPGLRPRRSAGRADPDAPARRRDVRARVPPDGARDGASPARMGRTAVVALSPPAFVYATEIYPEMPAALCLVGCAVPAASAPGVGRGVAAGGAGDGAGVARDEVRAARARDRGIRPLARAGARTRVFVGLGPSAVSPTSAGTSRSSAR